MKEAENRNRVLAAFEDFQLAELVDVRQIQTIFDSFYAFAQISIALIDRNAKVLASAGEQDLCSKFHRVNPLSLAKCKESSAYKITNLKKGEVFEAKCKNNLYDMVTPVYVADRHLGNIFLSQFLYDDEPIDYDIYKKAAKSFGFDEADYLQSLDKIPRYSRDKVKSIMGYYKSIAQMISSEGYRNYSYAQAQDERNALLHDLLVSEARQEVLLANIQDVIVILDKQCCIRYQSMNAEIWFGYTNSEVIGKKAFDFLYESDAERLRLSFENFVENGRILSKNQVAFRCKDNSYKLIEMSAINLLENPSINGILVNFHDITSRELDRKNLENTNALLSAILESSEDLSMFALDTSYNYLAFNSRHEKFMLSYFHTLIEPGMNMLAILEKENGNLGDSKIDAEGAASTSSSCDFSFAPNFSAAVLKVNYEKAYSGSSFLSSEQKGDLGLPCIVYEHCWSPIKSEDGTILGVSCIGIDCTETKKQEAALAKSDAENRAIVNSVPDLLFTVKVDGTILSYRTQDQSNLYVTPEQFLNKKITDIVPKEIAERIMNAILKAIKDGVTQTVEYSLPMQDGFRSYEDRIIPISKQEVFTWIRDITDLKKDENMLRHLIQEKEMLMRELQHRVKNSLNVAISLLGLEAGKASDDHLTDVLNDSISRLMSMSSLYEQLYVSGNIVSIDIARYIEALCKGIYTNYCLHPELISFKFDAESAVLDTKRAVSLGLILNEALTNAFKYAFNANQSGSVAVSLTVKDGTLTLCVADTGKGFDQAALDDKYTGLGFELIHLLSTELSGDLKIDGTKGTSLSVSFGV